MNDETFFESDPDLLSTEFLTVKAHYSNREIEMV